MISSMQLNDAVAAAGPHVKRLHAQISQQNGLYQHTLLDSRRLAERFQLSGRLSPFDENLLFSLWAHGLVGAENRADREKWLGADSVKLSWPVVLSYQKPDSRARAPRFHLYRLYPLWRIYRATQAPLHPIRFPRRGAGDLPDPPLYWEHIDGNQSFIHNREFLTQINVIATLAIVCEPTTFTMITGRITSSSGPDLNAAQACRYRFRAELDSHLRSIGMEPLETIRIELCRAAQLIDPNVRVQKLMRFCDHDFQMNLKGSLFIAVVFNQMAETIRRASESAFSICLPEEDEVGYLQWNHEARIRLFGTGRPLNAPPRIWKAFLRDLGVDPGIKARAYVEGSTEYGALNRLLGDYTHVEIIDLAGRVHQKGKIAFLQNLKSDMQKQIFSYIFIDTDKIENVRAVRRAAARGEFFGEGYLFSRNFDHSAVSEERKIDAILEIAKKGGATASELIEIRASIDFSSGFDRLASDLRHRFSCLHDLKKGLGWGSALAETIVDLPVPTDPESLRNEKNMLIKARGRILMSAVYDYMQSRRDSMVCPETLQLTPR